MIILTKEQANEVRGIIDGAGLEPILLKSGEYVLGEQVLLDPAHAQHHELLAALPKREVTTSEYESYDEMDS
jgi:hypothetical protein